MAPVALDLSPTMDGLSYTTTFLRAEYLWGF
jgi:hypothetical protein